MRHGVADYAGGALQNVEGGSYTISHGVTPGVAVIRVNVFPDVTSLPAVGTVTITDGEDEVVLPGCKLDEVVEVREGSGVWWEARFRDRRWRWVEFGALDLCANQLDPHSKLIGWMAQSPTEIAKRCLLAMKESGFTIDMPPGLANDSSATDFLPPGENYPPTGTNPPIDWDATPPAQALQHVADLFGRRIVLRVTTNTVAVVVPGVGADLPPGSIFRSSPALKASGRPEEVAIVGDPTRYQGRFMLQAVGEEWDGTLKPINALSYAPTFTDDAAQVTVATIKNVHVGQTYTVTINGVDFSYTTQAGDDAQDVVTNLAASINVAAAGNPAFTGVIASAAAGGDATTGTLTVTGVPGVSFSMSGSVTGGSPTGSMDIANTDEAHKKDQADWSLCPPPLFATVKATDRLTRKQAIALAQKTVWKYYQLVNLDVSGEGPILVPGFGRVVRRQQILLLDTQVDQVKPEEIDTDFRDRGGEPLVLNYYNGYSRDKPAVVYGSVSRFLLAATYVANTSVNTKPADPVLVPFTIDPTYQVVIFSSYVYAMDEGKNFGCWQGDTIDAKPPESERVIYKGRIAEPRLTLQTSCNVRDVNTSQFRKFILRESDPDPDLGGILPPPTGSEVGLSQPLDLTVQCQHRPDVQLEVTSTYDADGMNVQTVSLLELDAIYRAQYYLQGLAYQSPPSAAETRGYNGIVSMDLDGAISQVTWEVGPQGATTVASRNTEHHLKIPPYPQRRRQELLRSVGHVLSLKPNSTNPGEPPQR